MALKSDAYGFLVGAPVEWGRALQTFTEIRDEIRGLRGDIAGSASLTALQRAADAVSRQASAVTRSTATKAVSRLPPAAAAAARTPKPAAAVPARGATVRGANGRFVSATPAVPTRAAPVRGTNGRFVSATPAPAPRQPYRISVVGVADAVTPDARTQPSDTLTSEEFEMRRARSARPSSRDEIRRQNEQMSQTRVTPSNDKAKQSSKSPTAEQRAGDRAADRAAQNAERDAANEAGRIKREKTRAAKQEEREEAKREREFEAQERYNQRVEAQIAKEKAKDAAKPGLATHAFNAVSGAPEIDPTIAAVHEVQAAVAPIGRGLSHLFGRPSSEQAWYKRIWNELRGSRKDQSSFHKAEQKTLQNIDDKTGGSGGGLLGRLGSLLGKIPGVGFLGRLIGGGAGTIGRLALRAGGGLLRGGAGLLRRLPLIGMALEAGSGVAGAFGANDDPAKSAAENRAERFRSGGAGIGAALGGGIGMLLGGPLGSMLGQAVGDKVGELVGKWLSTLDWAKIGATITSTWEVAVKGFSAVWDTISKWLKDTFHIATAVTDYANNYVKDKTGVDVKATSVAAAQIAWGASKTVGDVAKKVAGATAGYVEERATLMASPIGNAISALIETSGVRRVFRRTDGSVEQRDGGSVSWRNNNSGNLKFEYAGSADKTVKSKRTKAQALAAAQKRYDGVVDLDQWGNAIFDTEASGDAARAKLIKGSHGNETVEQMLKGYAKDDYTGKANIGAYSATVNKVAAARGLDLTGKKISDLSPAEFAALMDGMKKMEGFTVGKTTALSAPSALAGTSFGSAAALTLPVPSVLRGITVPQVADVAAAVPMSLSRPQATEVRVSADAGDVGPTVSDQKIARLVSGGLSG